MRDQQTFRNQDLVLRVSPSVDPARFDISRYEPFLDALCGTREYQKGSIRTVLRYLPGGRYSSLRDLAEENIPSNETPRDRYGTFAEAALLSALSPNRRAPAGRTYAGSCTGVRSCIPAGRICTRPYALAAGGGPDAHAIRRTSPVSPRTPRRIRARRLPTAPGAHTTADRQGEALDDEPVARGEHLPQHVRNPDHPIGERMEATMEARDADPLRQIAQLTHHRRRPFVMTANIPGGDDCNRQNLEVGDMRPHITAMPQAFHQRVDHDNSGDNPRGVHRLLLAMMLVRQPRSCQRCRWSSTSNQDIRIP
jgi:hypothetical protein